MSTSFKEEGGWGCRLVIEHLPSVCKISTFNCQQTSKTKPHWTSLLRRYSDVGRATLSSVHAGHCHCTQLQGCGSEDTLGSTWKQAEEATGPTDLSECESKAKKYTVMGNNGEQESRHEAQGGQKTKI